MTITYARPDQPFNGAGSSSGSSTTEADSPESFNPDLMMIQQGPIKRQKRDDLMNEEGRYVVRASHWLTYRNIYTAITAIAANPGSMWRSAGVSETGGRASTEGASG